MGLRPSPIKGSHINLWDQLSTLNGKYPLVKKHTCLSVDELSAKTNKIFFNGFEIYLHQRGHGLSYVELAEATRVRVSQQGSRYKHSHNPFSCQHQLLASMLTRTTLCVKTDH